MTLNVMAGVAAGQGASAVVLAATSTGWAIVAYAASSFFGILAAIAIARASASIDAADRLILERTWRGDYGGETLRGLSEEIRAVAKPGVALATILAIVFAAVSVGLLIEGNFLSAGIS